MRNPPLMSKPARCAAILTEIKQEYSQIQKSDKVKHHNIINFDISCKQPDNEKLTKNYIIVKLETSQVKT